MFEFGEEVFDQVARLVKFQVIFAWILAIAAGWNHAVHARLFQGTAYALDFAAQSFPAASEGLFFTFLFGRRFYIEAKDCLMVENHQSRSKFTV